VHDEVKAMEEALNTRREFIRMAALGGVAMAAASKVPYARGQQQSASSPWVDERFFIRPEELSLRFRQPAGARRLSFANFDGSPEQWRRACREKLKALLGFHQPAMRDATLVRAVDHDGVTIQAWVMTIDESLSIPAYLLLPKVLRHPDSAVIAIQGHGDVEGVVGVRDDYHHAFGLRLAQAGHRVLCPALRGFGALRDLAFGDDDRCLDYWCWSRGPQFTLVTDAFVHGTSLIGQTVEDLLRWDAWLADHLQIGAVDVAGISYGGDLAITYPALSDRVRRIYTSGSMGSFSVIFARCYNAPAHCIANVLEWMDRSDIAGLSAPRPLRMHYGELDTPGPKNNSASYNETVEPSLRETRAIYRAFGADADHLVTMYVAPNAWHEMDNEDLTAFLAE
jgi:pimeloyl-ACP methyl ester carboxylesterase